MSAESQELQEILSNIDVSDIESVEFFPTNGESFRLDTENIKKLTRYITTKLEKEYFQPHELDLTYGYVIDHLYSEISEDKYAEIQKQMKLFIEQWWSVGIHTQTVWEKWWQNPRWRIIGIVGRPNGWLSFGNHIPYLCAIISIMYIHFDLLWQSGGWPSPLLTLISIGILTLWMWFGVWRKNEITDIWTFLSIAKPIGYILGILSILCIYFTYKRAANYWEILLLHVLISTGILLLTTSMWFWVFWRLMLSIVIILFGGVWAFCGGMVTFGARGFLGGPWNPFLIPGYFAGIIFILTLLVLLWKAKKTSLWSKILAYSFFIVIGTIILGVIFGWLR